MEAAQAYFNVLHEGAGESWDVSQEIYKCEYQGCVSAAGAFFSAAVVGLLAVFGSCACLLIGTQRPCPVQLSVQKKKKC